MFTVIGYSYKIEGKVRKRVCGNIEISLSVVTSGKIRKVVIKDHAFRKKVNKIENCLVSSIQQEMEFVNMKILN